MIAAALVSAQDGEVRVRSITGNVTVIRDFVSASLGNKRDLVIYLPPDYEKSRRRYSVLYMADGQNLFDGMTSYLPNKEWRLDETAEELIRAKKIEPLIIVGIHNAGVDRANEYLPTRFVQGNSQGGGRAPIYLRFLTEELKPFIDRKFRTLRGPEHTGLGGSSFGGIITLYSGLSRPDVFSKLAVVSPSVWWDNRVMLKFVEMLPKKTKSKIWVDIGTAEGPGAVPNTLALRDALVQKGWILDQDLRYMEDPGAIHQEGAWAKRMPTILQYLFPYTKG
ncbi:MAG: alpha/beta hydrolase [Fimbriimonas sp.]